MGGKKKRSLAAKHARKEKEISGKSNSKSGHLIDPDYGKHQTHGGKMTDLLCRTCKVDFNHLEESYKHRTKVHKIKGEGKKKGSK